MLTLKRISI